MSQTMLLTKRLSAFLANSTSPQLQTLLLLAPTGKLLSSASPSSASVLRTQATLACSLWNLYHPFPTTTSSFVSSSLPSAVASPYDNDLNSITIQLSQGIMVVRALKSGLLFVAIGPSTSVSHSPHPSSQTLHPPTHLRIPSSQASPPSSPSPQIDAHGSQTSLNVAGLGGSNPAGGISAAPSEAGSVGTSASLGAPTSIWGVRRQAEEVAKWLEGNLEGFVSSIGEAR